MFFGKAAVQNWCGDMYLCTDTISCSRFQPGHNQGVVVDGEEPLEDIKKIFFSPLTPQLQKGHKHTHFLERLMRVYELPAAAFFSKCSQHSSYFLSHILSDYFLFQSNILVPPLNNFMLHMKQDHWPLLAHIPVLILQ